MIGKKNDVARILCVKYCITLIGMNCYDRNGIWQYVPKLGLSGIVSLNQIVYAFLLDFVIIVASFYKKWRKLGSAL